MKTCGKHSLLPFLTPLARLCPKGGGEGRAAEGQRERGRGRQVPQAGTRRGTGGPLFETGGACRRCFLIRSPLKAMKNAEAAAASAAAKHQKEVPLARIRDGMHASTGTLFFCLIKPTFSI